MRRRIPRLVIILAAVAGFVIAGFVSFDRVTEQRLTAKRATVKKPGAIDAYRKLLAELEGRELTAADAPPPGEDVTDFPGFPEDAADIVAEYDRLFVRMEAEQHVFDGDIGDIIYKSPNEWTTSEKSTLREYLAANQDLIRQIRHAAARGGPVYPLDFSDLSETGLPHLFALVTDHPETELPQFFTLPICAGLLNADAGIKAAEGDNVEAVEDIIAGMRLCDALKYEPFINCQLLRINIYESLYDTLQDCFNGADLSPELTLKLMPHVAEADNRHAFTESLRGELYWGIQFFADLRTGDRSALELWPQEFEWGQPIGAVTPANLTDKLRHFGESFLAGLFTSPVGSPWLNMDEEAYVDLMTRTISAMELPHYEAMPELDRIGDDCEELPTTRIATKASMISYLLAWMLQARHEIQLDLIQMGILLEQYHARTGSYPTSLDAIAPDFGSELPVDPFSGEGYRYLPSGDSFLLYSVGPNLIDDGGKSGFIASDIVWRGEQ
jgi:hypothetical protein